MNLPKVSIWSLFRDDAGTNLERYKNRIDALDYPPDKLRIYCVEGDSQDDTWAELIEWTQDDKRVRVVKCETGLPRMSHTPHPVRIKTLAMVGNKALHRLAGEAWGELACLIESDLIYNPATLRQLVERRPDKGVIAPMVWIPGPKHLQFYDCWGYRFLDGTLFPPNRPEWFNRLPSDNYAVASAGSFVLVDAQPIHDGVRYTEGEAIRGICHQYRELGHTVYVAPDVHVFHPMVLNPYEQFKPDQKQIEVNESNRKLGAKQWA